MERTDSELCIAFRTCQGKPQQEAWCQLYERHCGLLRKLSTRYRLPGISRDDLFQQAILGLRYAAMTFDEAKAKFNTHLGWGVFKFCLLLRTRQQFTEYSVSQNRNANELYSKASSRRPRAARRLTGPDFLKLAKVARQHGLTEEECTVLAAIYNVGGRNERRARNRSLYRTWMERHASRTTAKLLRLTRRCDAGRRANG